MKNITSLLVTFLLTFSLLSPTNVFAVEKLPTDSYYGKVTRIIDGNSFTLKTINGENLNIKIAGIETVEYQYALELTEAFILGKNVRVQIVPISSTNLQPYYYGIVYYNGDDVAKQYLLSGYATFNSKTIIPYYSKIYTSYQFSAQYYGEGIWD